MDARLQNLSVALDSSDPFLVEREREELVASLDARLLRIDLRNLNDPLRINVALVMRELRERLSMTPKRVDWDPYHFTRSFCARVASGNEYIGVEHSIENVFLYAEGSDPMTALAYIEALLEFKDVNGSRLDSSIEAIARRCDGDLTLYCDELLLRAQSIEYVSELSIIRPACTFSKIPDPNDLRWHSDWEALIGDGQNP